MPPGGIIVLLPSDMLQLHQFQQQQSPQKRLLHLLLHCALVIQSLSCHLLVDHILSSHLPDLVSRLLAIYKIVRLR